MSRDTLQSTTRTRIDNHDERLEEKKEERTESRERQNDWRAPTEEPRLERDEEQTAPPQLRRYIILLKL